MILIGLCISSSLPNKSSRISGYIEPTRASNSLNGPDRSEKNYLLTDYRCEVTVGSFFVDRSVSDRTTGLITFLIPFFFFYVFPFPLQLLLRFQPDNISDTLPPYTKITFIWLYKGDM